MIYGPIICSLPGVYHVLCDLDVSATLCGRKLLLRNQEVWGSYLFLLDGENNTIDLIDSKNKMGKLEFIIIQLLYYIELELKAIILLSFSSQKLG